MSLDRQPHRTGEPARQASEKDGLENLRRFMSILREWDQEEPASRRERRGRALAERCFTEDDESD